MPLSPTYCRDLAAQFAPCEDREILRLFAARLSRGVQADLAADGALDLGMSETLDAAALVAPLGSKRFPTDNLQERNWVLGELVPGYGANEPPTDQVERDKQLFVLVCYLHANSADASLPAPIELVTAMIVERASSWRFDERLVLARFFLGIAIRYEPHAAQRSVDPRPLLLAAIACLVAGIFADLSTFGRKVSDDGGLLGWAISKPGVERWQRISQRLLRFDGDVVVAATDVAALLEERPEWL